MQTKSKKLLSILLTLCMMLTILPMTALPAFAANEKADSVYFAFDGGITATLNSDFPFLVGVEAKATAPGGNYTAYLDTVKGELILNNYVGRLIQNNSNGRKDLTVILKGENIINNGYLGSRASDGDIIITTDGVNPGSLTITNHKTAATEYVYGISTYRLGDPDDPGAVIIKGSANITIDVSADVLNNVDHKVFGILAKQGVSILENASLDIKARYTGTQYTNELMSYGIYTRNVGIKMNTTGDVSVDASGAGAGSHSVGLGTTNGVYTIERAGILKLKWTYYSIYGGPANRETIFDDSIDPTKFLVIDEASAKQTMTYIWKDGPQIDVSFTATQVGGASGTADTKAIELKFDRSIAGLTADKVTVEDDSGRVTKGELTGLGDTWKIGLAKVHDPGKVKVSVADFEMFHVISNPQYVTVYKNLIPPIAEVEIEVAPPVVGETPAAPVSNTENTTIQPSTTWNTEDETFQAGKTYRLTVLIYPATGYSFSNTATAKINGNAATIPWQGTGFINCYYDFTVDADPAHSDATLAGIVAKYYDETHKSASFTEAFNPETYSYTVNLPEAAQYFSFGLYTKAGQTVTATVDTEFLNISPASELYDYDFETNSVDTDDATKTVVLTVTAKDGETTKDYTITVNQGVTPPATYTVTIQNDGNGTGSASPTTAEAGTEITLSASPDSGYVFKEWEVISGGVMVTDNKFTMPANDVTVKAIFEETPEPTYSVTVGAQTGTLTAGTAGSVTYTVTTANIADGSYPATLTGAPGGVAVSGDVVISGNSGTLTVNTTAATPAGTHPLTLTIDGTTSAGFNLVVGEAAPVTVTGVSVLPSTTSVQKGGTKQFSGMVTFSDSTVNYLVTWSVDGAEKSGTDINSTGLLTVAGDETAEYLTVTATSEADGTKKGTATVIVTDVPVVKYTLTVTNGTGGGHYAEGETVNITANTAPAGQEFDKWTTSDSITFINANAASTSFIMIDKAVTVTATYKDLPADSFAITVQNDGNGTANANVTSAEAGTEITLSASPDSGYVFKEWEVVSGGVTVSGNKFTMPANDVTVKAHFEATSEPTYSVTVQDDGNGTGSASPTSAEAGTEITLSASPDSGYVFKEWEVISGGVTVSENKFTMPANDVIVKAHFEATSEPTYSVTIIGGGSGADGARDYEAGDPVTIKAGNNSGYTFTGWTSPDVTITNASDKTASFTMPAKNVTVTANWRYNGGGGGGGSSYTDYTITASADKGGSISPSGSVTVREKSDKTFTITADKGYVISDVLVDGKSVGALKTYTFTNVTKAHTIKAKFVEEDKNNPNTGAYIPFDDVKINDWFINSVMWAYENGLMVGTSTTTFSPNMETTRGMIVTILYRLEGSPKAGTSGFDDVSDGKYYANAVAWAADNKIVSGYGNGKFGPDDSLTREQLVTILYNYSKFKGYDITAGQDLGSFNDEISVSGYAKTAMQWAVKHGIVKGIGADLLSPATTATRAQMAAILERYSENIVE